MTFRKSHLLGLTLACMSLIVLAPSSDACSHWNGNKKRRVAVQQKAAPGPNQFSIRVQGLDTMATPGPTFCSCSLGWTTNAIQGVSAARLVLKGTDVTLRSFAGFAPNPVATLGWQAAAPGKWQGFISPVAGVPGDVAVDIVFDLVTVPGVTALTLVGALQNGLLGVDEANPDGSLKGAHQQINPFDVICVAPEGYGAGCRSATGVVPELSAIGCPAAGTDVHLQLSAGTGPTTAVVFAGLAPTALPLGFGCTLLTTPSLTLALPLPATGQFNLPAPLPPGTGGLQLFTQAFVLDPGTPLGAAASNGVAISIAP